MKIMPLCLVLMVYGNKYVNETNNARSYRN